MGVVYEAMDAHREVRVALKTLIDDAPAEVLRLKNEFRRCAGILHHNLVELHELFVTDDALFFTMEYVDGVDLLTYGDRCRRRHSFRGRSVTVRD